MTGSRAPRALEASRQSLWLVLVSVCALASCRARTSASHSTDSEPSPVDSGAYAREAGVALAVDAAPLPDDAVFPRPSEELRVRARHLLEAIAQDDVDRATDIVFPRDGWLVTHDLVNPGKDWDAHVATPFRKAVHSLSRRHRDLKDVQAVSIELGGGMNQTAPKRHGWKKPLWSVRGSRLTFVVGGHTHTLPIREMVAWRGAWYVTRLR